MSYFIYLGVRDFIKQMGCIMTRTMVSIVFLLFAGSLSFSNSGFDGRAITNNVALPTAYTLNKGEFLLGIGPLAFGVSDKFQIGANVLSFAFGAPNVNMRLNFLNTSEHAFAAGVGVGRTVARVYSNDVTFLSWQPFIAYSRSLSPNTFFHSSLNLSTFANDEDVKNAEPLSYWRGTSIDAGIEYGYSNRTKFLAEGGYDFTFKGPRLSGAVLWGWKTFRLKLGVGYYNPKGLSNAFISPVIGLWWRFGGV